MPTQAAGLAAPGAPVTAATRRITACSAAASERSSRPDRPKTRDHHPPPTVRRTALPDRSATCRAIARTDPGPHHRPRASTTTNGEAAHGRPASAPGRPRHRHMAASGPHPIADAGLTRRQELKTSRGQTRRRAGTSGTGLQGVRMRDPPAASAGRMRDLWRSTAFAPPPAVGSTPSSRRRSTVDVSRETETRDSHSVVHLHTSSLRSGGQRAGRLHDAATVGLHPDDIAVSSVARYHSGRVAHRAP